MIGPQRVANPTMDNLQDVDQKANTLDRLWAYLKIRYSLKPQSTSSEIQTASEAALEKGFLTPYTNFQWINQQNKSQLITFEDLNPVFFQGKGYALKKIGPVHAKYWLFYLGYKSNYNIELEQYNA